VREENRADLASRAARVEAPDDGRICGDWRALHLHAGRWRRQRRQMAPESDAGLRPSMLASLPTRSRSPWEAAAVAAISYAAATEEMTSLSLLRRWTYVHSPPTAMSPLVVRRCSRQVTDAESSRSIVRSPCSDWCRVRRSASFS
jgi:hypothetical protein